MRGRRSKPRLVTWVYVLTVLAMTLVMTGVKISTSDIDVPRVVAPVIAAEVLRTRDLRTYNESQDRPPNMNPERKVIHVERPLPGKRMTITRNAKPVRTSAGSQTRFVESVPLDNFYTPPRPADIDTRGRVFDVQDVSLLTPPVEYLDMNTVNRGVYTIVTWSDADRYESIMRRIPSIQAGFIGHDIVIYDVGMTREQSAQLESLCHVTTRRLDLTGYPGHVTDLSTYAFRPVAFRAALIEFSIILWLEPEFSLPQNKIQWQNMFTVTKRNDGWIQNRMTPALSPDQRVRIHREFTAAVPHVANRTQFVESGAILAYNSERVYTSIVHWWYACALDSRCFNGVTSDAACDVTSRGMPRMCRHNDQTILDVLVANAYGPDASTYTMFTNNIAYVRTKLSSRDKLKIC